MKCVVTLTKEMEAFMEESLKSGEYRDPNGLVVEALEALKSRADFRKFRLEQLRSNIQRGMEEVDRGDIAPWNLNEILSTGSNTIVKN